MNGPYFHPPVKVTVNQVNTPSDSELLNPYEIELENLKKQNQSLREIQESLSTLETQVESTT